MDPSALPQENPGTQLRIAMGMRGGVSLAVWMGGACSEVDRLRHSLDEDADPDGVYRWLLEAGGHTSVAVDVLAGASAGGLNSVLMSCSVVHDMRFDSRIRDLWLRLGDLGGLVRRNGGVRPPSLLDGDASFYGALARELRTLVPAPGPGSRPPRLDTILTCTLFSPAPRTRYQDLGPPIVEKRNRAWFRFRSRPADGDGAFSDFGTAADLPAALDRLAYAARATSSFPGAFEPASIGFARDSRAPSLTRLDDVALPPTHYGVYSESRPRSATEVARGIDRDHVIDGGVLDNIPLAWAVRSIAAAPADCPVDRWLLYLQPVPFAPPQEADPHRPRTFDAVRRARQLKGGTEALADDLDELERLRRDAERRRGFQQVLEYALGQVPEGTSTPEFLEQLCERALAALPRYRERAGAMEAGRIRELWTDPLPVLCADPLSFADSTRDPLPTSHACMLPLLPGAGAELVLPAPPDGDPPTGAAAVPALATQLHRFRSGQVLARTVSVLLDAARALGPAGLELKARLYEVRQDIELHVAHADRALAAAPGALPEPPTREDALVEVVRAALPGGGDSGWPCRPDLWDALVALARELAAVAEKEARRPQEARAFLGCLVRAAQSADDPAQATAAVLAAVELLTGPLRPDPLAETTPVRFHMISALTSSPLVPGPAGGDGGPGASADKLAGNQLRNFGAFLSAQWRLNDWTWGRLDASASLVDVLLHDLDADSTAAARLRTRLGVSTTGSEEDPLAAIRTACVRRLHEVVLREELPVLAAVGDEPPRTDGAVAASLPPDQGLDPSGLERIGAEKLRDVAMRGGARLPALGRLVTVAAVVVGDGAARRARRQAADLVAWAAGRMTARARGARPQLRGGR